jgi:hypothetical protein
MILHLVPDEKFIDRAFNIFDEVSPNSNKFIVLTNKKSVKHISNKNVIIMKYFDTLNKNFLNSLRMYDFVVLHWLDEWKMRLILKADKNIKFLWIGWGGDYYNYILGSNKESLFLEKTNVLRKKLEVFYKRGVIFHMKSLIKKAIFLNIDINEVFDRIDFFAPVLEVEYQMMRDIFQDFHPRYIDWNYGELNDNLVGIDLKLKNKKNILLGNSATFENNHIEAIDIIKKLDIKDQKVIVPLSYGNSRYAEEIVQYGKNSLNYNFQPLTKFMKIDEYNSLISSCSIVIMNHLRKQALSNIIAMLYSGAKVFLQRKNPIYSFLKNKGIHIFSIDELSADMIKHTLSSDEIFSNQDILKSYLSREIMIEKTRYLINTIKD